MARPRADDYDDKRKAILKTSAALFAEHGYDRASMNQIAKGCGVSELRRVTRAAVVPGPRAQQHGREGRPAVLPWSSRLR